MTDENGMNTSRQTEIQEAMTQDTPVKSANNSAYIDNIIAYDREVQRITKSVCSKLDLGQLSLPGTQSYKPCRPEIEIKPPKIYRHNDKYHRAS